jgi:hypothetical protein
MPERNPLPAAGRRFSGTAQKKAKQFTASPFVFFEPTKRK